MKRKQTAVTKTKNNSNFSDGKLTQSKVGNIGAITFMKPRSLKRKPEIGISGSPLKKIRKNGKKNSIIKSRIIKKKLSVDIASLLRKRPTGASSTPKNWEVQTIEDNGNVATKTEEIKASLNNDNRLCKTCGETFTSTGRYLIHFQKVHGSKYDMFKKSTEKDVEKVENLPDEDDPNFHCRVCQISFENKRLYRTHLTGFHNMTLKPPPTILQRQLIQKFSGILPDPRDPNYNCCVCQRNYSSKSNYLNHLKRMHDMDVTPFRQNVVLHVDVVPDINDPNLYCAACEKSFNRKQNYIAHLERIHNIARGGALEQDPAKLPDINDPNFYCRICDKKSPSKGNFQAHCRAIHSMHLTPDNRIYTRLRNSHMEPDENDPNNYCRVCERKYIHEKGFRTHLRIVHDFKLVPRKKFRLDRGPLVEPETDKPDLYCSACEKTFANNRSFHTHLRSKHFMKLEPLKDDSYRCLPCEKSFSNTKQYKEHVSSFHKTKVEPSFQQKQDISALTEKKTKFLPDINDPNFFCRTCKKTFRDKEPYHKHLSHFHRMNLKQLSNESNAESTESKTLSTSEMPNENDPDFYCSLCDKNSPNKHTFHKHLELIHKMKLVNKCEKPTSTDLVTDPLHSRSKLNLTCKVCSKVYKSSSSYRKHLRVEHNILDKLVVGEPVTFPYVIKHPDRIPDVNSPNCYCCACEKKFANRSSFRRHVTVLHNIEMKPKIARHVRGKFTCVRPDLTPDIYDPRFYCIACERKYSCKFYYHEHLQTKHDMFIPKPKRARKIIRINERLRDGESR